MDKMIRNMTLELVDDRSIQIWVEFSAPQDISVSIAQPDVLVIKLEMPWLIIDLET